MDLGNYMGKVKNIIFNTYAAVYDFDVKSASNGGEELVVITTFRTYINQVTPIRVKVIINKKENTEKTTRIYETKAEKISGLKEDRMDVFLASFLNTDLEEGDVDKFIGDNKDIIGTDVNKLEKGDIEPILKNRLEQLKKIG
ncbi:MAG: hypothetical protein KAU20_01030 [Nanoarchaeota archaeon]|nr:hypothetical protein [Nanoarchaeota archaeon]